MGEAPASAAARAGDGLVKATLTLSRAPHASMPNAVGSVDRLALGSRSAGAVSNALALICASANGH